MNKFKLIFGILAILILSSFAFADLTTSNVLYYSFDDVDLSGSDPLDLSINGNDGTNNGATTGVAGKIAEAFSYTTNDYINAGGVLDGLSDVSVSGCFETTGNAINIFGHNVNTIEDMLQLSVTSSGYLSAVSERNNILISAVGTTTVNDGNSHCFIVTSQKNDKLHIYLDNNLEASSSSNNGNTDFNLPTGLLAIGALDNGGSISSYFEGVIDEFSIWSKILDSSERTSLYNSGDWSNFYSNQATPFMEIISQDYEGNAILNFNATVNGTDYQTTNGTIITTINATDTIDIDITSFNGINTSLNLSFTGWETPNNLVFNYSVLNVTARNIRTNLTIDNFTSTINTTLINPSSNNYSVFYLSPDKYFIDTSATGYNTNESNLTLAQNITNFVSYHYAQESLLINVLNESSGLSLNGTDVSILFEFGGNATEYNTSTGEFFISNLSVGEYSITLSATGFDNAIYSIDVNNNSFQTLNAYLSITSATSTVFTVKRENSNSVIEGATVSISKLVGDEWLLVNSLLTDLSGKIKFFYDSTARYKFTVTADGYEDKNFELNPIIFDSYNIFMEATTVVNPPTSHKLSTSYSPGIYYNNENNTIEIVFSSPTGSLEYYDMEATYKTTTVSDSGSNAYGETLTKVLEITNSTFGDKVYLSYSYLLTGAELVTVDLVYSVADPDAEGLTFMDVGNDYGMGFLERVGIVVALLLLVGGVAYLFGGIVTSSIVALMLLGYFMFVSFVTGWVLIPTMIFVFIAMIGGSFK